MYYITMYCTRSFCEYLVLALSLSLLKACRLSILICQRLSTFHPDSTERVHVNSS